MIRMLDGLLLLAVVVTAQVDSITFAAPAPVPATLTFTVSGDMRTVGLVADVDTAVGQFESRLVQTRARSEPGADRFAVQTDTLWTRYRETTTQPWRHIRVLVGQVPAVNMARSPLMLEQELMPSSGNVVVAGLRGQPRFEMQRHIMSGAERWSGVVRVPYTVVFPDDSGTVVTVELSGRATFALDSVVPRTADTLAYVQVRGGLTPVRATRPVTVKGVGRPITVWGSLATRMVWSTGWGAWVTGQSELRMQHRVDPGDDSTVEIFLFADLVARYGVRP